MEKTYLDGLEEAEDLIMKKWEEALKEAQDNITSNHDIFNKAMGKVETCSKLQREVSALIKEVRGY